ncbi:hypothetical protein NHH03_27645 [Stieleria sp. TO1_6]|nr:hypothetical protein [Stieleria tagensis]
MDQQEALVLIDLIREVTAPSTLRKMSLERLVELKSAAGRAVAELDAVTTKMLVSSAKDSEA